MVRRMLCTLGFALCACSSEEGSPGRVEAGGRRQDGGNSSGRGGAGASSRELAERDAGVPTSPVVTEIDESVHNYVFVTSSEHAADFGEVEVADGHCNDLADRAGLPGSYVAWLSTSTVDAQDRLPATARGWARPDGLPFALSRRALLAGEIVYPPRLDEHGTDTEQSHPLVFTGTESDGTLYTGGRYDHCADWTSTDPGLLFRGGIPSGGPLLWTAGNGTDCSRRARLYCFGTDNSVEHVYEPGKGRLAFVSEAAFLVGGGIDAADAICQAEAEASGHDGEFLALLAPGEQSAAGRFQPGDPWVRPDGALLTEQASSLLAGEQLAAPIAQQADGVYVSTVGVWSGASDVGTTPGTDTHCHGWTSTSGAATAGLAAYTDGSYFDDGSAACDSDYLHVYCFQR